MPKQDNKVVWKVSELEKKFLALEGEVEVMRREAKARERRISDLELRNTRLEDCVQQVGKNITAPLDHVTWDKISRITIGIGQAMLSGQLSLKLFLF